MSLAVVTLKKGEGRLLKSGGMWVFDNEIASIMGSFVNGDIVLVHDFDGYPLGRGFINTNSKITVRMLTRDERTEISPEFLKQRVRDAWEYRKKVVDTGSCRVIFGEADFLPGLVIDKFSDVLVVESLALGIDRLKPLILEKLVKVLEEDGIHIRGIYERSDAKVRLQEGMERYKGFIGEPFDTKVEIVRKWCPLSGRCQGRAENWLFPRPEIQPSGNPASLPGQTRSGLFYPHRLLCLKCSRLRRQRGHRRGCVRTCRRTGA